MRSRHTSRHVRHAPAVVYVGIDNPRWRGGGENVPGILGAWVAHDFTYLARGPWLLNLHGAVVALTKNKCIVSHKFI